MKLNIILITTLIIFFSACNFFKVDRNDSDLYKMNLKGNVKSISIQYLYADSFFGKNKQNNALSRIDIEMFEGEFENLIFNKSGYLVESEIIGEGMRIYKYAENSKGQITEEFADSPCNLKKVYLYDKDKKLQSKTSYFEDNSWGEKKGTAYVRSVFSYERDVVIEKKYHGHSLDLVIRKNLDKKGRITKQNSLYTNFYGSGKREVEKTFKYNRKGHIIKKMIKDSIGVSSREETYEYIIDEKGNWIQKVIYLNGKKKYVAVRDITYFNSPSI